MSSQGFRTSCYASKSKSSIDLKELSGAVGMLKVDPHLPAKLLRPLLMNSVAQGNSITAQYMANFRRRCAIFHATNPN